MKSDCRAFYGLYTQYRFLARDLAGDRQPVQLSGLAFPFSDIGIIGSASRLYQLHNYIKYLKYFISTI